MKNPIRIDHLLLRLLLGRRWQEKLWVTKKDQSNLINQVEFFFPQVLSEAYHLKPLSVCTQTYNPSLNPGLVKIENDYLLIARSSRLRCYNDIQFIENERGIEDINYLHYLNADLQTLECTQLDEELLRKQGLCISGCLSDVRLFLWQGGLWGIGAALRLYQGKEITSQVLCRIENHAIVQATAFDSPLGMRLEKNWSPLVHDGDLYLIYSFEPFCIAKVDKTTLNINISPKIRPTHRVRGGTPFIEYGNVYLGLVHHSPIMRNGKRSYTHSFVTLTKQLHLLEISEPFFLSRRGIEFAAGINKTSDGIIISYGIGDRASRLLHIPETALERYLTY